MIRSFLPILSFIIFGIGAIFCAGGSAQASRPQKSDPAWTLHTSFDNRPRRVMDTRDAVYLFGLQMPCYKTSFKGKFNTLSAGIFKYDKSNPSAGLQDLASSVVFSGTDMLLATAHPSNGMLAVAYEDGGVDVIRAGGSVTYFDQIKQRTYGRPQKINNISFDREGTSVWVATEQGFLHIDLGSLKADIDACWMEAISDIARVGETIVAIADGNIIMAPASGVVANPASYTPHPELQKAVRGLPVRLMPVDDHSFAYLTDQAMLVRVWSENGEWKMSTGVQDSGILQANNADLIISSRADHTAMMTEKGWYVASVKNAYTITPNPNGAPVIVGKALPAGGTVYSSSYDGEKYWIYRNRGLLCGYESDGGTWSDPFVSLRPQAPLIAGCMKFLYSKEHGLIAVNQEAGPNYQQNLNKFGPHPVAYKDGKWRNLSSAYNPPYIMEGNQTLEKNFDVNANAFRFPVSDPNGACLDPLHPDILHMGSNWDGTASINLNDPRQMPVICSCAGNYHSAWPWYDAFYRGSWSSNSTMRMLGCDADGNLWIGRSGNFNPDTDKLNTFYLYWWSADARREALNSMDASKSQPWNSIEIQLDHIPGFYSMSYLCTHPANKGLFMIMCNEKTGSPYDKRELLIYDTNGTPEDTSDDTMKHVYTFVIEDTSATVEPIYAWCCSEDPRTGEIILGYGNELVFFNPRSEVKGFSIPAKVLTFKTDRGLNHPLTPIVATDLCHDSYGRLWIATQMNGVIGVTPDRNELVAHYTTSNSRIPSDNAYGVGWNPDTQSLFISTDRGIAEVKVDQGTAAAASAWNAPVAVPSAVTPDFGGIVAIHNVPRATTLKVTDHLGHEVASLPLPSDGITYWDLTDAKGKLVPSGIYTVSDVMASGFSPIIIPVTR